MGLVGGWDRMWSCCRAVGLPAVVLWAVGCGEEPAATVPVRSAGQTAVPSSAEVPGEVQTPTGPVDKPDAATRVKQLTGIRFDVPKGWAEQPQSEFYEAKYVIPSGEGDMTLTLTTMGGGIEANLQRWVGQFGQASGERPRRDTLNVDGTRSEWLDVRGTFRSQVGSRPGPHENWRLLGVAIPMSPRPFLLKLVGPRAAVSSFENQFRGFVRSAQMDR